MTAEVVALDRASGVVELKGPNGAVFHIQGRDPVKVGNLQPGMHVDVAYGSQVSVAVAYRCFHRAYLLDAWRGALAFYIPVSAYFTWHQTQPGNLRRGAKPLGWPPIAGSTARVNPQSV
jgi:hypothetical protein